MRIVLRTCLIGLAMAAQTPLAWAQAGKFDGTYAGVSAAVSNSRCPTAQTPGPLTMANGSVSSASGFFTGSVDASGHVVMHTTGQSRIEGQIDAAGTLTAGGGPPSCSYTLVWQKR